MSYREELQNRPALEDDERARRYIKEADEEPKWSLNLLSFCTGLFLMFTPAVVFLLPGSIYWFFGRHGRRTKQMGLSALCGGFCAFAIFVAIINYGSFLAARNQAARSLDAASTRASIHKR